jgi:hypothetical protein
MAEQAKIEARLVELEGMQDIQNGLEHTRISEDEPMHVDKAPEPPRPIEAKLRALEKFVRVASLLPQLFFFWVVVWLLLPPYIRARPLDYGLPLIFNF